MNRYRMIAIYSMIFFGCTQAPTMHIYTLEVPSVETISTSPYKNKVIKIAFPYSLREQMNEKMHFSYSNSDYGSYMNSEWSNNISKLMQGTLIDVLSSSKLFKAVLASSSTLQANYRLESNIFTFEHRVRDKASYANVSIQFTLIDADTGTLVKSKRFSYTEATPTVDAKGYAIATNRVMYQLSQDLVSWIK